MIGCETEYADGTILKGWCNTFKVMYPYEIAYLKDFMLNNVENMEYPVILYIDSRRYSTRSLMSHLIMMIYQSLQPCQGSAAKSNPIRPGPG